MSWLFFMDESGHDHKQCPYEVRGGIALHSTKLWSFVQAMQKLELKAFGCQIASYSAELKGSSLLDRKRFMFAEQGIQFTDEDRQRGAKSFLEKTHNKAASLNLRRDEFTAYGQACLYMAKGIFQILEEHEAKIFASIIPGDIATSSDSSQHDEYFRKDHVFLLERYFYMLEELSEDGLLVMDECEKQMDRRFVDRMQRYFKFTTKGRYRVNYVIPSPFFVSSDMTYAVQAADVCIYTINWGFRNKYMDKPTRHEIADVFESSLKKLQYKGKGTFGESEGRRVYGIVYVPDPYNSKT